MSRAPMFVPAVQGACRGLCRGFHWCAGCAGSHTCARTHRKTATPHTTKRALMRICTRHTRHTRHMHDLYTHFHASPGTRPGTRGTHPIFIFKKKVMEKPQQPPASRTIRCTPENAADMRHMVKTWPALHSLVQHLQAQGLFPGLRAITVTLTGDPATLAQGMAAVHQITAKQPK